jgi:hypothetical protein
LIAIAISIAAIQIGIVQKKELGIWENSFTTSYSLVYSSSEIPKDYDIINNGEVVRPKTPSTTDDYDE